MAVKIQVKRGKKAGLPTLAPGEYGLATDTGELFIGGPDGNIQVAVLGSDHKLPSDHLPAHSHGAGDITSGILGVARGGTGKGSFNVNRLIYPSAATTLAQLGFPAVAGSVLRQGTSGAPYWTSPADLISALGLTNAAKIATGSYVGTGTYGANNPCSLTFPFMPELVIITRKSGTMFSKPYGNSHKNLGFAILIRGMESYTGNYSTDTYEVTILWSDHGISWYQESSYSDGDIMLNLSGVEYCFIAIG